MNEFQVIYTQLPDPNDPGSFEEHYQVYDKNNVLVISMQKDRLKSMAGEILGKEDE